MKHSWFPFLAGLALTAQAQTNSPLPDTGTELATTTPALVSTNTGSTNEVSFGRTKTEIFSESGHFDLKERVMVYVDKVRVLDPQMKLTCEIMTVTLPESGRPDKIVAERNVIIDGADNEGRPIHATGDKATYTYRVIGAITNETVVLTGNPRVVSQDKWMTGDEITWDRANNSFSATHPHVVFLPETKEHTNAPAPSEKSEKNKIP